jgi:ABC-type nitrate/sulfonate/bicarbonate transport system permease component
MNGRASELRRATVPLWFPVVLVLAWQAVSSLRLVDPLFFPAPTRLLEVGRVLAASGELTVNLAATLLRCLTGFAIGGSAGLVSGIVMGVFPHMRRAGEPVISALYTMPKLSLLPLLMLLIGVGDAARLTLVALSVSLIVTINTLDGLRAVDRHYAEMAVNYGAKRWDIIRGVYLPSSLPQVFTGFRLGLGRALVTTISIELVSSESGLGHMVWMAWQTFAPEKLYVGVLLCAALGAAFHATLRAAERQVSPWRAS